MDTIKAPYAYQAQRKAEASARRAKIKELRKAKKENGKRMTWAEIGIIMGISRQRACQLGRRK